MNKLISLLTLLILCVAQNSHARGLIFDTDLTYYENLESFYNNTQVPAKKSFFEKNIDGKYDHECVMVLKKKQDEFKKSSFVMKENPKKSVPTVQGGPLFKKIPNTPKNTALLTLERWKNKAVLNELIGNDFVISVNNGLAKIWLRATDNYVFYKGEARHSSKKIFQEVYGYCWKK